MSPPAVTPPGATPPVVRIQGIVRDYAWGSTTSIQQLLGLPVDDRPAAELWLGAHPDDPASVPAHATTLDVLIDRDAAGVLGDAVLERFGARLPFLLKVLAADKALSIQVHPTLAQARAGFACEDAAGVARDAATRTYRDPNHKPELLCALTPFEALCGFRPVPVIRDVLAALSLPELRFLREALDGPDPLRAAFTAVLTHPDTQALSVAVAARSDGRGDMLRGARTAAQDFPGDVGVVLALLLNYVRLEPGEAIFLGAGNVHAYLRGTGVEIMANSDNVLRCGLTPKHVDVTELLAVTDFTELTDPRWPALGGLFDVPVPDFRLARLDLDALPGAVAVHDPGPCIVLCASGSLRVGDVDVTPGHAAFVRAGAATTVEGTGLAFVASVGL